MTPILATLFLLTGLQVKHVLADFYWQSGWMVRTKGIYGHPGGLAHTGLHVALSATVLIWAGLAWGLFVALLVAEFAVHYHADWAKDRLVRRGALGPTDRRFWTLTGIDQFVHQMTYLAMVAVAALVTVPQ